MLYISVSAHINIVIIIMITNYNYMYLFIITEVIYHVINQYYSGTDKCYNNLQALKNIKLSANGILLNGMYHAHCASSRYMYSMYISIYLLLSTPIDRDVLAVYGINPGLAFKMGNYKFFNGCYNRNID